MKIEMVVPSMVAAGMETVVADLSRSLVGRGHSVGITCLQARGNLGEQLDGEGIRVSAVSTSGLARMFWPAPLTRWFRRLHPDVVHAHSGVWLKAARAARAAGVPTVIHTMHGIPDVDPWYRPLIERWAAMATTTITVVSEPLRTYVVDQLHVRPNRVHVLPNGVNTERFKPGPGPGEIRRRFELGSDRVIVGHVARFSPVKNHKLLLDAFATVRTECPEAFLALVGDGPLRGLVQAQATSLGITEHVGFCGLFMDPAPLYRDFDVFVLPSLLEQTSMSLLEAMASALPVVATRVGGSPDLLDHGNAGTLVESGDQGQLANALISLIRDPGKRQQLGRSARARVLAVYDHEKMVDGYETFYGVPSTVNAL
jgi:glycosyltransferase involved in cell wall biosynthesis